MDRRNGGDPLAPPRPPKLLPRVHRPRAPEPTMMSEAVERMTTATATGTGTIATPQCTNSYQQQHLSSSSISSSSNNNYNPSQQHSITTAITPTTTTTLQHHTNNFSNNSNFNNFNNNNNNVAVITTQPEFDDYQIHHLTFLPQRPSSLSRNSSHVSNTSSLSTTSSSITAANSFTRRRPPPPPTTASNAAAAVPLLNLSSTSNSSNSSGTGIGNNFLSHFHSIAEPVPASPVTLAQPRPESERLTNEYVDTPLRTAQQLQHASRTQHPAGQHDNGQTTTHHLLLLPQRELRQQQQQSHHHQQQQQQLQQQHSNRLAGTAGSANVTTGTDGTDGFLHSHHHSSSGGGSSSHKSPAPTSAAGKHTPPAPPRSRGCGSFLSSAQPITQPITKQPASSASIAAAAAAAARDNSCNFVKELPALDDLLDLHNIATGIATPQGMVSAINGASPLGTPIIIGGAAGNSTTGTLNSIMCPRCDRCRCEQCQLPRPLPQTWVCNKTCLCSAESVIDYMSCLCCAKALFYHCARDNDMDCDDGSGTPCVDNPCSCGPYKRTQRWGWLGVLSLLLPCLWCYWPMRGCIALCEKCYGRYAGRGCRCQHIGSTSSMLPIVPLGGINGSGVGVVSNDVVGAQNGNTTSQGQGKSMGGHVHHHHHSECASAASRILRKGDLTPEKRLLDSSPEY